MSRSLISLLALAALALVPQAGAAQGREGFHPRWEVIPGFDIHPDGGWRKRARNVQARRAELRERRDFRTLNAPAFAGLQATSHTVSGTMLVPILLFHYQDTGMGDVRDTSEYSALLWGTSPPLGRPYTLRTYYEELSRGDFSMQGQTIGWAALGGNAIDYEGDPATDACSGNPTGNYCNGINSGVALVKMQNGFREALGMFDAAVDFSQFDNDGPDLVPNSGDDDGFVDMMAFAHATQDGACGNNNRLWAHRYFLLNGTASAIEPYDTDDAAFGGGVIRIRDYFIQSGLGGDGACDDTQIMPIGTAAHEFGHALGLPDLYDVSFVTEGIGRWGLMGSGNYSVPNSPARMEAWSLDQLGWVEVVPLDADATYSFGPAPTADTVFYVEPVGSNPRGEYFLVENRQPVSADTGLIQDVCVVWHQDPTPPPCDGGLLIWHVDGSKVASGLLSNSVNAGSIHGLTLEEADGARDLWCAGGGGATVCNRGDAGDVYPGEINNTVFSAFSTPAAVMHSNGAYVGFDIDQIAPGVASGEMTFRLRFGVGTPMLTQAQVLPRLFDPAATTLTPSELAYLDQLGNGNAQFDVGDFKAWVDATGAPAASPPAAGGAR